MEKQKIAIYINSLARGGAERVVSILLQNLQKDFELHLIMMENKIDFEIPQNQIIHIIKKVHKNKVFNYILIPFYAKSLRKYLEVNNITLIFSLLTLPNLISSFLNKSKWDGKVIISERTMTTEMYDEKTFKGLLVLKLIRKLYPFADKIIPNSKGVQHSLESRLKIVNEYEVIYNPIDLNNLSFDTSFKDEIHKTNDFTFINVGNFFTYKNKNVLIDAFDKIKSESVRLILIGDGPELIHMKKKVRDLNLEDKILFVGFHSSPCAYLKIADCFVSPSNIEGFPNVILEALGMELPVVATDCKSGPREILAPYTENEYQIDTGVEFAEYGLLVPINNHIFLAKAMLEIYTNLNLRENYISKSKKRASSFNIDIIIDRFRTLFLENIKIEL